MIKTVRFLMLVTIGLGLAFPSWAASSNDPLVAPPDGFVLQPLVLTDGLIARPKAWFFGTASSSAGWTWIIAKEDPAKGPYETGMRIQVIVGVKQRSGKTAEDLMRGFIAEKRNTAKVVSDCQPTDQGQFIRECLSVIEDIPLNGPAKPYHVAYTVFWGKTMDMAVLTTFGAPADQWGDVARTAEVMNAFRLIGPNFGKSTTPTPQHER
jgi:hypothetical protein